jgi:hypothetical protein
LSVGQACDCIRQAALGLSHAYERGLRHHDLKPANLLLSETHGSLSAGLVKIRNLGLTVIRQPTKHTRLDVKSGRQPTAVSAADYMAPERVASGESGDIRAEIYSLGCSLYYLLAGQVPFPGGTVADKHRAHEEKEPTPIEHLRDDVPPPVAGALRRLMAKQPEERPQAPAQVAAEMAALSTAIATATTPDEVIQRWRQRQLAEQQRWRRRVFAGIAALGVGLTLFLFLLFRTTGDTKPRTVNQVTQPAPLLLANDPALVIQCGRTNAGQQTEVQLPGYGYELQQGDLHDGWGPPTAKSHCWHRGDAVRFVLKVPPATRGKLRMHFVSDNPTRSAQTWINGKEAGPPVANFDGPGKFVELPIQADQTRDGHLTVELRTLAKDAGTAISTVEFVPFVPDGQLPRPAAALLVQCGKGKGRQQDEVILRGYGYKLTRGNPFDDWPASAARPHRWNDKESVQFQLKVPPSKSGTLRLLFVDGSNAGRKQKLLVQGKEVGEFVNFGGAGQWVPVKLTPAQTKTGTVDVAIQNLNRASWAVVSTLEFVPD